LVCSYVDLVLVVGEFIFVEFVVLVLGKVFDLEDFAVFVDVCFDGWLIVGWFYLLFECVLVWYVGVWSAIFVNSGLSVNLVALSGFISEKLGKCAFMRGDEVLIVVVGFLMMVNLIIQNGFIFVVVDIELGMYDAIVDRLREVIGFKMWVIMMVYMLGNFFDLDIVCDFCKEYYLWFVEDLCDVFGSIYDGQRIGSFGDMVMVSFYLVYYIIMGEGGVVGRRLLVSLPIGKVYGESEFRCMLRMTKGFSFMFCMRFVTRVGVVG